MSNLPTTKFRAFDNNGDPLASAHLFFYVVGTTTTNTVYSDYQRTTPHANPVVADANGLFAEIYLTPGTNYRIVLKDSTNTTTYFDVDNVSPASLDGSLSTHAYETANNPLRYNNAVGDGVADESAAVQAAIDAVGSRYGVVDLLGRTFRCDSQITLTSGITLRNGILDFSACDDDECVLIQGSRGSNVLLASTASEGATSVAVASTTGMTSGDIIYITDGIGSTRGELQRSSINVGVVTPHAEVEDTYSTASSAYVQKLTTKKNVTLENLVILCNSSSSGVGDGINIDIAERVTLRNVHVRDMQSGASCVRIGSSVDVNIDGCNFGFTSAASSYGVYVLDAASDITICNSTFVKFSKAVYVGGLDTLGGVARRVSVIGCSMIGCTTGVEFAYLSRHGIVRACHFATCTTGVTIAGRDIGVSGSQITDSSTGVSIVFTESDIAYNKPRSVEITNNNIEGSTCVRLSMTIATGYNHAFDQLTIEGNRFRASSIAIDVDIATSGSGTCSLANFTASNNVMSGAGSALITYDVAASATSERVTIANNIGKGTGNIIHVSGNSDLKTLAIIGNTAISSGNSARAIDIANVEQTRIIGNTIEMSGSTAPVGIYLVNTALESSVNISNNIIYGATAAGSGIYLDDIKHLVVNGNTIGTPGSTSAYGLYLNNATSAASSISITGNAIAGVGNGSANDCGIYINTTAASAVYFFAIAGNTINSTQRCIWLNGYFEGGTISGNTMVGGNAVNSMLYLSGGAASAINNIAISGNAIREGVYGIEVSNTALVIHDGNSFFSQSTAITTGAFATAGDSCS